MVDNGCGTEGCSGNPYAIIHIRYMGGFPATVAPKVSNLGRQAEESYVPPGQEPANPLANMLGESYRSNQTTGNPAEKLGLVNDVLTQGLIYKSWHDPKAIHAYLVYEENQNGSMNISSIDVWNNTSNHVNLLAARIKTNPMSPCFSGTCMGPAPQDYGISRPESIHSPGYNGLGLVSPHRFQDIPLIPSGARNEQNLVSRNTTVNILSSFSQYNFSTGNENIYGLLDYSFRWW
jgi:hypothetical protein